MFSIFCLVVLSALIAATYADRKPWLPESQIPTNIQLQTVRLILDLPEKLETRTFNGTVIYIFYAEESTQILVMYSSVTEILSIGLSGTRGIIASNFSYDPVDELLRIKPDPAFSKDGLYELTISYVGELRTDQTGLYILPYLSEKKETEFILGSNFKPKYARRALPCFDEPNFRSIFNIDIKHSAKYKALSNALQAERIIEGSNSTVMTSFEATDDISVHQLSISLIKFTSWGGDLFEIHGMNISSLKYARDVSVALVLDMAKYTDMLRPKKHDIVAIPTDQRVLAIDNTGLSTYRDLDIEFDAATKTSVEKIKIIIDIGRGMAHYFFGGCLTPASWSDLWLSDGLANWLAYTSAKMIASQYSIDEFFIALEYQPALLHDSFENTEPISVPYFLDSNDKIETIVTNPILSAKSASLVRMIQYSFGEEEFKKAIQAYGRRLFQSLSGDDFLKDIQLEINFPHLANYFKDWLNQKHYPIITVERNYDDMSILITQNSVIQTEFNYTWFVPFDIISAANPNFTMTRLEYSLEPGISSKLIDSDFSSNDWIILNSQQVGFYRTNYDLANWNLLTKQMFENHSLIHFHNRAQLLDDAFRLAELRILPYEISLNLSLYLKNEKRFAPWATADNFFRSMKRLPWEPTEQLQFDFFIRDVTLSSYSNLRLTDHPTDHPIRLAVREIVTYWACDSWNEDCVCDAKKLFLEYIRNDAPISPNARTTVLCTGIKTGSRMELELAWRKFFRSNRKIERRELVYMLGCSRDKDFLIEVLYRVFLAAEPTDHTKHERLHIVQKIIDKGETAVAAVLDVMQDHRILDILYKDSILVSALEHVSKQIFTSNHSVLFSQILDKASKFWNVLHPHHGRLLRTVKHNMEWVERSRGEISKWLQNHYLQNSNETENLVDAKEPVCDLIPEPLCSCGCGCDRNLADMLIMHRLHFLKLVLFLSFCKIF